MRCPSCSSAVTDGRRFCPSCGTPVAATVGAGARVGAAAGSTHGAPAGPATRDTGSDTTPPTAAIVLPDAGYDEEEVVAREERTTQLLTPVAAEPDAHRTGGGVADAGAAIGRAGDAVRRHAGRAADRFGAAPVEVRIAMIGAAVTVLSFLALPYADKTGTGASVGGRLWWRPFAAIVATILLATTLRVRAARAGSKDVTGTGDTHRTGGTVDRLLAALVVATVGATEAGLVGLFSGDTSRVRIGYYGILGGLVTVLVAAARAARRRCGA